jgi:hypothetical protein
MSEKRSAEKIVKEFKRKTRRKPQGRLGRGRDWWTSSFTFEMSEKAGKFKVDICHIPELSYCMVEKNWITTKHGMVGSPCCRSTPFMNRP